MCVTFTATVAESSWFRGGINDNGQRGAVLLVLGAYAAQGILAGFVETPGQLHTGIGLAQTSVGVVLAQVGHQPVDQVLVAQGCIIDQSKQMPLRAGIRQNQ